MFDFLDTDNKRKRMIYTYIIFACNGMLALSLGSLLPFLREAKALDYAFAGLLVSLHSVGNFVSSFVVGILPVYIGRKKSILIFNAAFAISFAMILFGNDKFVLGLAFALTGIARGATSNYCNFEINTLAPGKAWVMNVLHAMFSIGAFVFPILVTVITSANPDNWTYAIVLLILLGLLSWILYLLVPVEVEVKREKKTATVADNDKGDAVESDKKNSPSGGEYGFFKEPLFYLTVGTLFFYLCAEQGVIGWMVTYFKDTGLLSGAFSQMMSSLMWVMMLIGRLSVAALSLKFAKEKMLRFMGFGVVVFFLILVFTKDPIIIPIAVCGFGLSMAGIYPTSVSFNGFLIQKYAFAWSYVLTLASLGSIIMPSVIGMIAETKGLYVGMSSVAVVIFIDLVFILALSGYVKKHAG